MKKINSGAGGGGGGGEGGGGRRVEFLRINMDVISMKWLTSRQPEVM